MSAAVEDWVGHELDAGPGDIAAERGYVIHWCEAVEDANPLYWDEATANELTGGWTAPSSMLSVWMRPLMFNPHATQRVRPLELHFQLKDAFELPEGIVTGNEIEFGVPVRMGDVITTTQRVRDISDERTNRLGTGRAWTIDVTYTNQRGEIVGVETYRMFSYNRTSA